MSDINDLERRITQALDRIRAGVETLGQAPDTPPADAEPETEAPSAAPSAAPAEPGDVERLQAALDEERTANAQLEERVRVIRRKQEGRVENLERELAQVQTQLAAAEASCAQLKSASEKLRKSNDDLRKVNAGGLADAHLINMSMMSELEALRAEREADVAEADAILAALAPIVEGEQTDA